VTESATEHALRAAERHADRFYGKYRGIVSENADPLGLGRLRAQVPDVLGLETSGWALPCAPYAGPNAGLHAIPPLGAGVWIEFEAGDPSRPIWVGGWWGDREVPQDERSTDSPPARKVLRTDTGLIVSLDDERHTVTISDANGRNLIRIDTGAGRIDADATTRIVLEAPLIKHGAGAQQSAVLGNSLLAYLNQLVQLFNTHVHAGETVAGMIPVTPAPPVPFFPPATPSLLSTKNLVQ
jgi:hypothetical protein